VYNSMLSVHSTFRQVIDPDLVLPTIMTDKIEPGFYGKTANTKSLLPLLSTSTKISVIDGRSFIGLFICTDSDMNIVLANATEHRHGSRGAVERWVGLIMVPGTRITSVQIPRKDQRLLQGIS